MLKNKGGFTLIELVMIIVILGILAAVAIPKYADLKEDALKASVKGVLGGMNSSTSIAYAKFLINGTDTTARCDGSVTSLIDQGSEVLACMDGTPAGWAASGTDVTYTYGGTVHTFPITAETTTNRAVVRMTDATNWP